MNTAKTHPPAARKARQFDGASMLRGAESVVQVLMACERTPDVLLRDMQYGQDDSMEHDFVTPCAELERRLAAAFDRKTPPDYREGFLRVLTVYLTMTAKGVVPTIDVALAGRMLDEYAGALTGTPLPAEPAPEPPAPDFAEDRAAAAADENRPAARCSSRSSGSTKTRRRRMAFRPLSWPSSSPARATQLKAPRSSLGSSKRIGSTARSATSLSCWTRRRPPTSPTLRPGRSRLLSIVPTA